jgi:hypothetical protein
MLIRRLNCIDAASGIVTLSKWPSDALNGHLLRVTIPDAASLQFNYQMVSI